MYEIGTVIWVAVIICLVVGLGLLISAVRRVVRMRRNLNTLPSESDLGSVGQRALANERALLTNELLVSYLNRLGDLLFVVARYEDRELPIERATGQRA